MLGTPPYHLSGEDGRTLGTRSFSLAQLRVQGAILTLRSLGADTLSFSIRAAAGGVIPDDNQWVTLRDDAGVVLFVGLAKRSFSYVARTYTFECANFYKGLGETPLLDGDRAFIAVPAQDIGTTLAGFMQQARNRGLAFTVPEEFPEFYVVPKMAFRSASVAGGIEDSLKWVPDCVTRADYSTTPPTLRFQTRRAAAEMVIDLDADSNRMSDVSLTAYPEARALAVAFAYARRLGDNVVQFLVQKAGNDAAEAGRTLSVYLSGQERSDLLVSEALTTAQKAVAMAQASVDAVGASITAAAASAQIPLTWAALLPKVASLQAAVTAQAGFFMSPGVGSTYSLFNGINWPPAFPVTTTTTMPTTALALRTSGGALATGWYPIETGAFSPAELTTAGATKETRYITGDFIAGRGKFEENAGMNALSTGFSSTTDELTGWLVGYVSNSSLADAQYRKYLRHGINLSVDAINMAPAAVAAAVIAAANAGSSGFIERAEFAEAPSDLAANYFERQDWTPYKGTLTLVPSATSIPMPGDFISIRGEDAPPEWASMKVPVAETSTDLRTQVTTITIGPSPRQDFSSLVDRLRIPVEDNYEAG